jgi:hypothetical protein
VSSEFAVIPAATGMMLGPQIISSIFFATSEKSRPNSFAYVGGVALASTIGMAIAYFSAELFGAATDNSEQGDDILTYAIVALLAFLAIKTFLQRKTAEAPEWMAKLQTAEPKVRLPSPDDADTADAHRHHQHAERRLLPRTERLPIHRELAIDCHHHTDSRSANPLDPDRWTEGRRRHANYQGVDELELVAHLNHGLRLLHLRHAVVACGAQDSRPRAPQRSGALPAKSSSSPSAVNLDSVESVSVGSLTQRLGRLSDDRMEAVCAALQVAADCRL